MKLHRDLGIAQSSAWYMAHRIRGMWTAAADKFAGPVEVDETYIGGKERNKHESRKLKAGRGPVGKDGCCWCQGQGDGPNCLCRRGVHRCAHASRFRGV